MSTVELRNKLKEKIDSLDQDEFLKQLLGIIELESVKSETFKIPKEHKASIEKSLKQIEEGNTKTHEEVMAKYKLWI